MSKGLEALNKLVSHIETEYHSDDYYEIISAKDTIEKELKALEIIKEKDISISDFKTFDTFASFNKRRSLTGYYGITKEEFDLLKEVLL